MSKEAARKLPRYAFYILLAIFSLCGLWATDLWTLRDAESFGIAWTAAQGSAIDWLLPNITGEPVYSTGPMTAWVSAVFIKLFCGIGSDIFAYRAASIFWFALSVLALWWGTWTLARRPEAQPVAFAFGGEAKSGDYARVVADCCVLLFVATFGIVTRQHEAIPDTALLTNACINFFGLAYALKRPYIGTAIAGLAAGAATLASTLFAGIWLLAASLIVNGIVRGYARKRDIRFIILILCAVLPILVWLGLAWLVDPNALTDWIVGWASAQASNFGLVSLSTLQWLCENFVWYLCPIWPFFLWGIYSWRYALDRSPLFVPLVTTATGIFAAFFSSSQSADIVFLDFIPSMAAFAAFSLNTVRKRHKNILDWFSLSIFSLGILTLWAYWLAWLTNFAPKMARSINMLAPGAEPFFDLSFAASLVITVVWFVFVVWRLTHKPVVAWRGPWLAAGGMTAISVVLLGLYHHAIDLNRSYQPAAQAVAQTLKDAGLRDGEVVDGSKLPLGVRALFSYYGGIHFLVTTAPLSDADAPAQKDAQPRFRVIRDHNGALPSQMIGKPVSRVHTDEAFYIVPSSKRAERAADLN